MSEAGSHLRQFLQFGLVGGSGIVVNLVVVYIAKKCAAYGFNISEHDAFLNLLGSRYHIRWYHVFMTVAFLVANTWNYQLNRMWTFKSDRLSKWWRGFFAFLATGLLAFLVSQVVATLLMNPLSPVALPTEIFDDSSGLRTKFYWALIIAIGLSMPVNFVVNKLWTFKPKPITIIKDVDPQALN
ncbi:GtrA family protein [Corynebacterium sp. ES2794-CONJ1]|uniref:GtrA family protein n=1 Tax=unclassified Corynebacterium TaxID=2624378 RepID=UPI0021695CBA|nr:MULTISPECIES: GtrA family protein [unclassified Corynebacterium]MCS4489886.1 GtrA family protein [Corynebacterium sp. ES2775-CONJ]MCS4491750.1 GtrA family protein [Corynebacterium sp. ES2715-CONJ3]MCS4531855.1 GtrA family protein [Corynebacterium sp. ES2730-CONJ]MCU9519252.1 GtrA family protein [Corynebacterium sp. ES2794-CONJ1]